MPPPTYQEAIADGIGPVGGPRGVYDGGDEGSGGLGAGAGDGGGAGIGTGTGTGTGGSRGAV